MPNRNQNAPPRGSTYVERSIQYVVQAIVVAAVIGGWASLSELKTSSAVMSTQLESLNIRFDEMREASKDRYTATQATKDFQAVSKRYDDHESRLRRMERFYMEKRRPHK